MSLAIMAGISMVGSIFGAKGDRDDAKRRNESLGQQASLTYDTRMEEIRRRQIDQDYTSSMGQARSYASGLQMGGSTESYLDYQDSEFGKEIDWMNKAASRERDSILSGQQSQSSINLGSAGSLLKGASQAYSIYSSPGIKAKGKSDMFNMNGIPKPTESPRGMGRDMLKGVVG